MFKIIIDIVSHKALMINCTHTFFILVSLGPALRFVNTMLADDPSLLVYDLPDPPLRDLVCIPAETVWL